MLEHLYKWGIKVNEDLMEDLDKLTDIIVGVIKANNYEVIDKYHTGRKGVHIDCDGFIVEAYTYPFLEKVNIWIFYDSSKEDVFINLVKQFELMNFIVCTAPEEANVSVRGIAATIDTEKYYE